LGRAEITTESGSNRDLTPQVKIRVAGVFGRTSLTLMTVSALIHWALIAYRHD
jgi:hypothetical protein